MKMTRRQLGLLGIAHLALAVLLTVAITLSGCTFVQAADEVVLILQGTLPVANGICAVVAIADPPVAAACGVAATAYTAAVNLAGTAYGQWQTADASAQPGALGAFEAAMTVVKNDFIQILAVAHVSNPTRQNTIDALAVAIENSVTEVITLVLQVKSAGGTTAAAQVVYLHEVYGGGTEPPSTPKPAKTKKAKLGKAPLDHKHIAGDLKKNLGAKTGDAQLDAVRAQIAAKLAQ